MNLVKLWKGTEQTRMNELDCFGGQDSLWLLGIEIGGGVIKSVI